MKRRCFLRTLVTLFCTSLAGGGTGVAADEPLRFRWRANVPQAEVIQRTLSFDGTTAKTSGDKAIGVSVIFAGAVMIPYLAKSIWSVVRDVRYGGLVIDMRGDEVVIENDPRLDGGIIVLIKPDGSTEFHHESKFPDAGGIASLIKAAKK